MTSLLYIELYLKLSVVSEYGASMSDFDDTELFWVPHDVRNSATNNGINFIFLCIDV